LARTDAEEEEIVENIEKLQGLQLIGDMGGRDGTSTITSRLQSEFKEGTVYCY